MKIVVLAGGTGGATLAAGFQALMAASDLTVIANTADDDEFWGLLVSPDVDAVIYRLAGVFNDRAGYGLLDESFHTLDALARLGEPTWFRIGDRDLATHVLRTDMLCRGSTLTHTTLELCRRFGVAARVLPMTDQKVRTRFATDQGYLTFQEYFVREGLAPVLRSIEFDGIDLARPTPEVTLALDEADLVVIGPSNPLISIAPILKVVGGHLVRERTVAITPIIGGVAIKGPTIEMMRAMALEPTPVEVARQYRREAGGFVLDSHDSELAPRIEEMGYRVTVCDTVMDDGGGRLATVILEAAVAAA